MTVEARLHVERGGFTLDVDMEAPEGRVTAVFGASGAGKTTFLRSVAGLEPGATGRLVVGGETWQDDGVFLPPHRRAVAYVFQEPSLFEHLSVRRNLEYGYRRVPDEDRRVGLDETVHLLGVGELLERGVADLSGGERQRVAMARALLTSPRLLLLDEPLASLDRASKEEILPYLERLHQRLDIPVLYVSHSQEEVARLADHLVLLQSGRVVASGGIADMLTRLDLTAFRGESAEAIIEATIEGHDEIYHLTRLHFDGGRLLVTRTDLEIGHPVRLRVLARDVSLTLERQSDTSILNILPVTVEEMSDDGPGQLLVRLTAGGTPLLARVTRKSVEALDLDVGKRLFAQVKTVALLT